MPQAQEEEEQRQPIQISYEHLSSEINYKIQYKLITNRLKPQNHRLKPQNHTLNRNQHILQ